MRKGPDLILVLGPPVVGRAKYRILAAVGITQGAWLPQVIEQRDRAGQRGRAATKQSTERLHLDAARLGRFAISVLKGRVVPTHFAADSKRGVHCLDRRAVRL